MKEFIAVVPREYDEAKRNLLKEYLESCGLKLLRYENELDQILNTIMNMKSKDDEEDVTVFFFKVLFFFNL